jgi:hypothetical protein
MAVLLNQRARKCRNPPLEERRRCDWCGRTQADGRKFSRCGKCLRVFYCSKECQVAGWRGHKAGCE